MDVDNTRDSAHSHIIGIGVATMSIPHHARSIARQHYRHWLYTGHESSYYGNYRAIIGDGVVIVRKLRGNDQGEWIVPIAKSWI